MMNIYECHEYIEKFCSAGKTDKIDKTTQKVFDAICKVTDDMKLDNLTFYPDREPAFVYANVAGEDMVINLYVAADGTYQEALLISMLPFEYLPEKENDLFKACNNINYKAMFGSFSVDIENKVINYITNLSFGADGIEEEVIRFLIINACSIVDIYNGALRKLALGGTYEEFEKVFID